MLGLAVLDTQTKEPQLLGKLSPTCKINKNICHKSSVVIKALIKVNNHFRGNIPDVDGPAACMGVISLKDVEDLVFVVKLKLLSTFWIIVC